MTCAAPRAAPQLEADAKLGRIYREIELPVLHVLQAMERHGVLLDVRLLKDLSREFGAKMAEVEAKAHAEAGQPFNLNSPRQIQEILFEKRGLPVIKKTPSGTPSTDEDVLEQLALDHPLPKMILEYRSLAKLKSTYTDKLPTMMNNDTGRVHTNYAQAVAVTGRLASNDPSQNTRYATRRDPIRHLSRTAAASCLCRYSQIECDLAHFARRDLLKAFAAVDGKAIARRLRYLRQAPARSAPSSATPMSHLGYLRMSAFASRAGSARALVPRSMSWTLLARYPGGANTAAHARYCARRGYGRRARRRLWLLDIRSGAGAPQGAERAAINARCRSPASVRQDCYDRASLLGSTDGSAHSSARRGVLECPTGARAVQRALPELLGGVPSFACRWCGLAPGPTG